MHWSHGTCSRKRPLRADGPHRGLVAGADAGDAVRVHGRIALCGCLQWAQGSADSDRRCGRVCRGHALSCAAAYRRRCILRFRCMLPLVFDIIDRWKKRSIGRCIYHVGSPDGECTRRGRSTLPRQRIGARSAFRRSDLRLARCEVPEEETNPIFPMTLDLRLPTPGNRVPTEGRGSSHDFRSGSDSAPLRSCV